MTNTSPFELNMRAIYGDSGRDWILNLPSLMKTIALRHNIRDLTPFENLTYNFVAHGSIEGRGVVLKLSLNLKGLEREGKVLEAFSGLRSIELIAREPGLLLMERAIPGSSLKGHFPERDEEAVEIFCQCIGSLQECPATQASLAGVPHVREWFQALNMESSETSLPNGPAEPLRALLSSEHRALAKKAFRLSEELLGSSGPLSVRLLHGDLHHDNIVQYDDRWVAIDPQGVWGPIEYEVAAFLFNPFPEFVRMLGPEKQMDKLLSRISQIAQRLSLSRECIARFAFCKAVLCATWMVEDGGEPGDFLELAVLIESTLSR